MNEDFKINLHYPVKINAKKQKELYILYQSSIKKYKKHQSKKNRIKKENIKTELCVGFYSLICHQLKKYQLYNYDNSIIILNKLIESIDKYDKKRGATIYTFFYHIIQNKIIDILRLKNKNKIDIVPDNVFKNIIKEEDQLVLHKVMDLIDKLPPDEKIAIQHKFFKKPTTKKYSRRYYDLCVKVAIMRIKQFISIS